MFFHDDFVTQEDWGPRGGARDPRNFKKFGVSDPV